MIILPSQAICSRSPLEEVQCIDENAFFFRLHNHLYALNESNSSQDRRLYQDARVSFDYFLSELGLNSTTFVPAPDNQITNWQFLNLIATGWKQFNLGGRRSQVPRDYNERGVIENVSVRALTRNDVIYTNLFRNQSTFSIYGADVEKLSKSLRQVMIESRKITL